MSFITDNSDRYALLNIATQGVHMWDIQARWRPFKESWSNQTLLGPLSGSLWGSPKAFTQSTAALVVLTRPSLLLVPKTTRWLLSLFLFEDQRWGLWLQVYIFHVRRDEAIAVLSGHSRTVNCVSWNPVYHQVRVRWMSSVFHWVFVLILPWVRCSPQHLMITQSAYGVQPSTIGGQTKSFH